MFMGIRATWPEEWHPLFPVQWPFNGYASEATHALATWAFNQDVHEIFAVVRSGNARAAATVRRNGMHWVGETTKYFGTDLQVFRLRKADIDRRAPEGHRPRGRAARSPVDYRS